MATKTMWVLNIRPVNVALEKMSIAELNYFISKFILEVRRVDGKEYPRTSKIYSMLLCLHCYLKERGKNYVFVRDHKFLPIKNTYNRIKKDLEATPAPKPQVISPAEEETMWERGDSGYRKPKESCNTVFYIIGTQTGLKSANKHRSLTHSQLQLVTLPGGTGSYDMTKTC